MSHPNPIIIAKSASTVRGPRIPGVFPSFRFGEQVLSTGVPSFDSYVGGGVPIGSICILKDTFPGRYADLILKCFIAEGASYNHHLYVASETVSPQQYVNELPSVRKLTKSPYEDASQFSPGSEKEKPTDPTLKIAWRYQAQGNNVLPTRGQKEAKFDFSHKCTVTDLGGKNITLSKIFEAAQTTPLFDEISSSDIINEIARVVKPFEIPVTGAPSYNNVVRIALSHCEQHILNPLFMFQLRALVMHTNSCAILTVSNLTATSAMMSRCENFADYVITLQAVFDERRKSELGDIDGICEFNKITSSNSIKPVDIPQDIGFSFKKKRLIFQELHLPPEGESALKEDSQNSSATIALPSNPSCGATVKGKSIDF